MVKWYRSLWYKTKVGTILATAHFVLLSALLVMICIHPGSDWPWWPLAPFIVDLPISVVINFLSEISVKAIFLIPHSETWLQPVREPLSSLGLFWLPGGYFLVFGTLWHYHGPQVIKALR